MFSKLIDQLVEITSFYKKINPPGCKSLSSVSCLRKANILLQKFVISGNDERRGCEF